MSERDDVVRAVGGPTFRLNAHQVGEAVVQDIPAILARNGVR